MHIVSEPRAVATGSYEQPFFAEFPDPVATARGSDTVVVTVRQTA